MTTLAEKISLGFRETVSLIKQVRNDFLTKIGSLSLLATSEKTSVVGAINELKSGVDAKPSIDDVLSSTNSVWSSAKVHSAITSAVTAIINGANADEDSLKELADKITALAQTDVGLVSVATAQVFTEIQKAQARANIGAVAVDDLGDLAATDFAAVVEDEWLLAA
jgi:hypothetical protein